MGSPAAKDQQSDDRMRLMRLPRTPRKACMKNKVETLGGCSFSDENHMEATTAGIVIKDEFTIDQGRSSCASGNIRQGRSGQRRVREGAIKIRLSNSGIRKNPRAECTRSKKQKRS